MHLLSCLLQTALGFSEWLWLEGIMSLSGFWQEVFSFLISMLPIRNLPPPLKSPKLYSYFLCCPLLSFVLSFSRVRLCNPMDWSTPVFPVLHDVLEFTQIHVHWVCDAIQTSHPLSSSSHPPAIFPSIRVFSNESVLCIRWPKYWSFSFSISPSNEYSGLISFRTDGFDILAVQGTLKSLLHYHSSNSLVLSLLYGPTLTSILDYCKNHSFDYTDLCWQSNVSAF